MSEEQNNQQAPQNTQPVGSFDPNAASYVPNSAAYNQVQQVAAQQGQPVPSPYQQAQPGAAPAQPATPQAQAQAPQAQPAQPYVQGATPGVPPQQPYQQAAPAGNPYQQNPYQPAAGMPSSPVKSHSTSTLVLGVFAIIFGFMSPLVAWILGAISLHFAKKDRQVFGPYACKAGRICAIVGIVIGIVMWALSMFLLLAGYADADVLLGSSSSSSVF